MLFGVQGRRVRKSPMISSDLDSGTRLKFRPKIVRRSPTISRLLTLPSKPGLHAEWPVSPRNPARQQVLSSTRPVLHRASRNARVPRRRRRVISLVLSYRLRVSGSRRCVMRKRRAPTTSKTRIAESAGWLMDTLVKPPKTRRTSESPRAPIISLACLLSWPATHIASLPLTACDMSSVLPASSPISLSKDKTTLDASIKNKIATSWRSRTAVSGLEALVRSVPAFPATNDTSSITEAGIVNAFFFADIPYSPRNPTISTIRIPSPRNTCDGTTRTIQGAKKR